METIVEKCKIAHFEQFHLFPQVSKRFFLQCVKISINGVKKHNESNTASEAELISTLQNPGKKKTKKFL